jgi:hypothetical protein
MMMKLWLNKVLPLLAALVAATNTQAQRGPRGYGESEAQAYAIWQPVDSASARSAQPSGDDATKIKVCIGYRIRAIAQSTPLATTRAYLVEHENGSVQKTLSEAVFVKNVATPRKKPVSAAPFWCFFSERRSPPPNVSVAEGSSRLSAGIVIQGPNLEYKEQPTSADLNRMMLDWVR